MGAAASLLFALCLSGLEGADGGAETSSPLAWPKPPVTMQELPALGSRYDGGQVDFFPDAGEAPRSFPWLHLSGNRVLPEELYRSRLSLPPDAQPDPAVAAQIEEQLSTFLLESGYDLASVRATVGLDRVDVFIDEGRLEKIVFRGKLTLQTLRFQLALFIDQDVFNRPALQRQIEKVSAEVGVRVVRWSLMPTANPEHHGFQLGDQLPEIEGVQLFHSRQTYELHFFFEEHEWDTGVGADVRSGYMDGLEGGVNAQGRDLFSTGDRWRLAASGGVGLRNRIPDGSIYPAFSRAFVEARWYAPKFFGRLRPYVWLTGTLFGRQRKDLGLENYNEASTIASGHLAFDVAEGFKLSVGLGGQWRRIFNLEPAVGIDPAILPPVTERLRTFIELREEWVIGPSDRWDRNHRLDAGVRYYFGAGLGPNDVGTLQYGWIYERYQRVVPFGWHDLILKSRARLAFGDVQFHDEEDLGELLRGVFGDTFVRKVGNLSAEFRFSLSRDVFKLSLFAEAAAWGQVDRTVLPNPETFRLGVAGGPGFHALIQGIFQLDIYLSVGLQTTGRTNVGALAILNKVF